MENQIQAIEMAYTKIQDLQAQIVRCEAAIQAAAKSAQELDAMRKERVTVHADGIVADKPVDTISLDKQIAKTEKEHVHLLEAAEAAHLAIGRLYPEYRAAQAEHRNAKKAHEEALRDSRYRSTCDEIVRAERMYEKALEDLHAAVTHIEAAQALSLRYHPSAPFHPNSSTQANVGLLRRRLCTGLVDYQHQIPQWLLGNANADAVATAAAEITGRLQLGT